MKVAYKISAEEFVEAQKVFSARFTSGISRFSYRYAIPIGIVLLTEGMVLLYARWNLAISIVLAVWGGWMILQKVIIWPIKMKKDYAQYPDLDRSMEFAESGVTIQTNQGRSELQWSRFTQFVETQNLFVLFAPPRLIYTLPKRVFTVPELEEFRHLLHQSIPAR